MLPIGIILWLLAVLTRGEAAPQTQVTFAADVQPILERRCTPCHFPGGVMHAKLPFDQPATIVKLGTRLFSRIKREDEQKVIRAFLDVSAKTAASSRPSTPAPAARPRATAKTSNAARAPKA